MSRALTPGTVFVFQVSVGSRSLNVGADVLGFSRPCRSTLFLFGFQSAQDLMSLIATMMAMTTMRMTRMMSR